MKLKRFFRRTLALALTAAALAGPMAFPSSRTGAETEFDTGGTAFSEPSYDTGIMYYWHKGLPTVTKDKNGNYIKYPVLITWDGQYFLCADENFKKELNETHTLQEKKNNNYVWCDGYESFGYISSDSYSHKDFDRVWGSTDYYMRYLYDMTDGALLRKLGMDIDTLKNLGEAVSIARPKGMPCLVATKPENDQYAIGLDEGIFGKDVWLVGQTKTWEWVPDAGLIFDYDDMMQGDVQWCLEYESWKAENFLNKNYNYTITRSMYDVDAHKSYTYSEGPDQHYWTVKKDANGRYHFWTMGENNLVKWERISGTQGKEKNRQRIRDWFHANDLGRMSLYYSGSTIGVNGETVKYEDWKDRKNTVANTDGFTVYYADPNIVSFHRDSFEVVDGQVVTLDGPRVIDTNCVVTVHSGGVLACNGWVINNGQILIEPGGMLVLTERDTATGDHQFGAVSSIGTDPDTASGRIACDGTMIINRDCKLICAGTYGLQLGESAQVVNYGQIIAENMEIYSDYAIENRGDTSAVFAGWGVTDSGYALTRTRISGQSYNAKGTLQKAAAVKMPRNAVYGDGAYRLYINSASSVVYTESSKQKGYVSGYVAPIPVDTDERPDLPSNIPIYYDERYDVSYITVDGVTYHYDSLAGYWVNVADGSHETFYNYRMPYVGEEFLDGKLPDGFVLSDGRIVGQTVKEDLYYDIHAACFWFVEDLVNYYYETKLSAYIHVESDNTYFRYPGTVAPPPSYTLSDYIPVSMHKDLPLSFRRYTDGMQEVAAGDVRPKVLQDGSGYYIIVSGVRLDWSKEHQLFIFPEGAVAEEARYDAEGNPRGVTADQVNLNGFNLEDPNGKPKVQKDASGYYVMYNGNSYRWYPSLQAFLNGVPEKYLGKPITKDEVDLNGYTLP